MEFTWANGRQLTGIANGSHTVSCQYDSNSMRTKKTVDGVTTEYFLSGSTLLSQVTGNTQLDFFYDDLAMPWGSSGTARTSIITSGTCRTTLWAFLTQAERRW